jgi:peptidoglycan/LPS O-acetylase OafA/YrhL
MFVGELFVNEPIKVQQKITEKDRVPYLDSIRGLAALGVAAGHCLMINGDYFRNVHRYISTGTSSLPDALYYLFQKMTAGRAAVMMFFVLSGLVLALSLMKTKISYPGYVVRRFFRIYPVFLVIILCSYAAHEIIGQGYRGDSSWFSDVANPDISLSALMRGIFMWGTYGSNGLDNVMWTLIHEIRISLIIPFMLFTIIKYRWRAVLAYLLLSLGCTVWMHHTTGLIVEGYNAPTFAKTFVNTGFFVIFFAVGIWIAVERDKIVFYMKNMRGEVQLLLFLLCAYGFFKADADPHTYKSTMVDYMRGLGAAGFIALALGNRRVAAALNHVLLTWLGWVSYSLYLVHIPILYVVAKTFGQHYSIFTMTVVVTTLSLASAAILVKTIEQPFILMGKRLSAVITARTSMAYGAPEPIAPAFDSR